MQKAKRYTGVVVEKDGKYFGVQYADGHSTAYGFGPIENAEIHDPEYCKKPTDVTWNPEYGGYNPYLEELKLATLRRVVKTVIYEVDGVTDAID